MQFNYLLSMATLIFTLQGQESWHSYTYSLYFDVHY